MLWNLQSENQFNSKLQLRVSRFQQSVLRSSTVFNSTEYYNELKLQAFWDSWTVMENLYNQKNLPNYNYEATLTMLDVSLSV